MATSDLKKRAASKGVLTDYVDQTGRPRQVPNETIERILEMMPASSPAAASKPINDPGNCYLPDDLSTWGWAVQLYAARSSKSWGIGDLADLREMAGWASSHGAGTLMINPLHASIPVPQQQASPYYPSSRAYRNPLYLRIEEVPGASIGATKELAKRAMALNAERLIDRDAIFALKMEALEHIWESGASADSRGSIEEDETVGQYAAFCVAAERYGSDKTKWPSGLAHRKPDAIADLKRDAKDRFRFHLWIQEQLSRQLQAASEVLPIVGDLAIGVDPQGADAWMWQETFVRGASIGAPPDEFNSHGQNWGLPPMDPGRLREISYAPFIQTVRSAFQHTAGLRIDHVMGLFRLFWIPDGTDPNNGAYVRYPAQDLLSIVALESQGARSIVVGEDLGTVEPSVRKEMAARRMLSQKVLWFEEEDPKDWSPLSIASVTTHDLPTIAGLLSGEDLRLQKELEMEPNEESIQALTKRVREMAGGTNREDVEEDAILAIHDRLGNAASAVVFASLDDALMVEERPNLPGSTRSENWSLALPVPLEELFARDLPAAIAQVLSERRP
ncbi:MAG: 4-alpha-glucanotransferase [Actinobacteria bacterium]|nr:4-alpha-glucanotransferase [Actinomycetota bacterium]